MRLLEDHDFQKVRELLMRTALLIDIRPIAVFGPRGLFPEGSGIDTSMDGSGTPGRDIMRLIELAFECPRGGNPEGCTLHDIGLRPFDERLDYRRSLSAAERIPTHWSETIPWVWEASQS